MVCRVLTAAFLQIGIIFMTALATVAFYVYVVFLVIKYLLLAISYILCCRCLDHCVKSRRQILAAENKRNSLTEIAIIMNRSA